jgi:hypothetical protein
MPKAASDRQDEPAFQTIVAARSQAVANLAKRVRSLVIDVLPGVFEVVWKQQKIAGYGTGPKKMTEHFCWIAPAGAHVSLGFNYGAELPDPEGLLEGTGRLFRHVKLASDRDVDAKSLRRLLVAATRHRVPPLPEAATTAKPRAKAPAKAKAKTKAKARAAKKK